MIKLLKFNYASFSRGAPKWKEVLWWVCRSLLFAPWLSVPSPLKVTALRFFGAKVGTGVVIRSGVSGRRGGGVLLSGLVLGWLGRTCSRWCEEHFGGYLIGEVVFIALFSIFWRANCCELLLSPVMWSLVLAWALHHLARICGWITPWGTAARPPEEEAPGSSAQAVGRAFRKASL